MSCLGCVSTCRHDRTQHSVCMYDDVITILFCSDVNLEFGTPILINQETIQSEAFLADERAHVKRLTHLLQVWRMMFVLNDVFSRVSVYLRISRHTYIYIYIYIRHCDTSCTCRKVCIASRSMPTILPRFELRVRFGGSIWMIDH